MRFTTTKDNFFRGISTVQRAVASKSPHPALSGILLEAGEKGLRLTGANEDLCIRCAAPIDPDDVQPGNVVLPARYLSDIVRRLPDGPVHFTADLSTCSAVFKYGRNQARLNGMDARDFPAAPSLAPKAELTLKAGLLKQAFKQVVYAAGTDDLRPIFTGVLLELADQELRAVATDTHRLTMHRSEMPGEEAQLTNIIVPAKALGEMTRILGNTEDESVAVVMAENYVSFSVGGVQLMSRLIDGQYPDYRQVIPASYRSRIADLPPDVLAPAVERAAALCTDEEAPFVTFALAPGLLTITADSRVGSVLEEIPVEAEGDAVELTLNAFYVLDALRGAAAEAVSLEFNGPAGALIVRPHANGDYLALVLPVRLS